MNIFMQIALQEAKNGIRRKEGGPFGCVIVKNKKIVAKGHNQVLLKKDPTCHGEMQAIRNACKNLNTYDLTDCELYTTGEPCPMCLAACMWANIKKIYFGCNIADNADIGFRDELFYKTLQNPPKEYLERIDWQECKRLFEEYKRLDAPTY